MNRFVFRSAAKFAAILLACAFLAGFAARPAAATTYTGTVRNGTTGSVAANVDVVLISLQGTMETVANTKTDAQGRYKLNYSPAGQGSQMPMLIRAIYKGVNFHTALPPGQTTADVQIYEPTTDPNAVQFSTRLVIFQPNGSTLQVAEEYGAENQNTPPVAYFKQDGDFEFAIPDGANNLQVSAEGPEHMPVVQGTIDRGKNKYAVAYAFRPGENAVLVSYEMPYSSSKATVNLPETYTAQKVLLVAPPSVAISASGFQPAGTDQGMNVYERDGVPAGGTFDVGVSGTAPPPDNGDANDGAAQQGRDAGAAVAAVPPRLDSLKWVLIGGFAALFLLGGAYLLRKPIPAAAVAGNGSAVAVAPVSAKKNAATPAPVAHTTPTAASAAAQSMGTLDQQVGASLDQLKDTLFKLELRHQAGTISEQDYAEQRARAEKILRDLVRG
jgi:hypothetical protein